MMESQSKVNPIIIESLKKVERLFRIKARIVDAINAKIQVERDKENVRHTPCYTSFLQRIQAKAR